MYARTTGRLNRVVNRSAKDYGRSSTILHSFIDNRQSQHADADTQDSQGPVLTAGEVVREERHNELGPNANSGLPINEVDSEGAADAPARVSDADDITANMTTSSLAVSSMQPMYIRSTSVVVELDQDASRQMHSMEFPAGFYRTTAIMLFQNILFLLRVGVWKVQASAHKDFKRARDLPYFSLVPNKDLQGVFEDIIKEIFAQVEHELRDQVMHTGQRLAANLLKAYRVQDIDLAIDVIELFNIAALEVCGATQHNHMDSTDYDHASTPTHHRSSFNFHMDEVRGRVRVEWPAVFGSDFVQAIAGVISKLREDGRDPTFDDYVGFHLGHLLLLQGQGRFNASEARFLGTVGFRRDSQTYCSLTDPGDGHIFGTTRRNEWMRGCIVHNEHLERPKQLTREFIESYRIPSIFDFARVRLHTGTEAPNTIFIGRPFHDSTDGQFEKDFVKLVGTVSAAVTGVFSLGAAECKIAMDGLTTNQMVQYMRALAGNALRNPRQYLSAAFNLNRDFNDDLKDGKEAGAQPNTIIPTVVDRETLKNMRTEDKAAYRRVRLNIALRAIEVVLQGGFNKVTVDGASDIYPSVPLTEQLGTQHTLEFVHAAHSVGLTTYISAGFKNDNLPAAVYTGVDGIGIGGAQILRYMDHETGAQGGYLEENIPGIIKTRDDAAKDHRGRAAHLLSRLDQMWYEGSIKESEEALRVELYRKLHAALENIQLQTDIQQPWARAHEEILEAVLQTPAARACLALDHDGEQPWIGRAKRLVKAGLESALARAALRCVPESDKEMIRTELATWLGTSKELARFEDEMGIYSYASSAPWTQFREYMKEARGSGDLEDYGSIRTSLKITPPSIPSTPPTAAEAT